MMVDILNTLLTNDLIRSFLAGISGPQWGIFQNGALVLYPDTIVSVDFKRNWSVADYPVEEGAFESYDKVQAPFDTRVRMALGATRADRAEFLAVLKEIADNTELYDVVTPDEIYSSVNISHYDIKRSRTNGAAMIVVDIWLTEVRVTAVSQFSNTRSSSGSDTVNGGNVQTSSFDESGFTSTVS